MADENTREYVLAADGLRLDGRRYKRGDKVKLPTDTGERLVASGSLVESEDDLRDTDTTAATAGMAPVADEASTLDTAQSVDADGEIKPSSFGHPDRVKEAEDAAKEQEAKADATRPPATRRRAAAAGGEKTPTNASEK